MWPNKLGQFTSPQLSPLHFSVDFSSPQYWDNINLQDNESKFVPIQCIWLHYPLLATCSLGIRFSFGFPHILFFRARAFGINTFRFWYLVLPFYSLNFVLFCALNGAHYVALFAAGPLWPCSIGKFDLN